ncbi:MAG TPA: hypothetical protein VGK38_03930 [Prolixibacteraceae bacterium]|jgi:hypothetical protein
MTYQVSIFLENKLGHLEKVTAVLKKAEINIRSLHLNHTANGWGILNLVVSNPELAHQLLNENGMSAALREIVVVKMADKPGGLDGLLKDIVKAEVNFTNAYGRVVNDGDSAFFVIDTQDIPDARLKLANVGLEIIADHLVYGIQS